MPKQGYGFRFKGIQSDDMGIWMVWMPEIPHPARKGKYLNIQWRDGALWSDGGGYENIKLRVPCDTRPEADMSAILAWLSGSGDLIFDMEPDRAFRARITTEYAPKYVCHGSGKREFQVTFDCQPFRYEAIPAFITKTTSSSDILNPGTVQSEPIITVFGADDIALTLGDTVLEIKELTDRITINSEAKLAYRDNGNGTKTPMTKHLSGDWPVMPAGKLPIPVSWVGNVTKVEIAPQWRWL